ncbi:MAG TPA: histidine kinase [Anaerolineaceae bacterium]|nr:histidine kinase [Anaerolineaceae bacterium]
MERATGTIAANHQARRAWKAANLAWAISVVSILIVIVSFGIAIQQAIISGDYRLLITHQTLTPFITTGFAVIGALVVSRHPRNPIGWIFVTIGLLYALTALAATLFEYGSITSPVRVWAIWFGSWSWLPAVMLPVTFVPLVFPDGHLLSPRWRFIAWSAALGLALSVLGVMLHPGPLWGQPVNPFGISGAAPVLDKLLIVCEVLLGIGFLGSLAAFVLRFRRSAGIEREQMKWLVYAVGMYIFISVISSLAWLIWPDFPWQNEINIVVADLGILAIAVAAAIAILRHRLYDIDLIINRTLVYSALTVGVAALYGLVVGLLGVLFQAGINLFISLLATGLAAILVQPMRDRLQRLVNRLMYGDRDDPYAVLSSLSLRLEGSLSPDDTLPAVVEIVAQALKLPFVAIALKQGGEFETSASFGSPGEDPIQLPLIFQGESLGQLRLSRRAPNEAFTPGEERLLRDIARHIGVTAHSVLLMQDLRRLAVDLQRSREELVKSREEERRRLRRDLHDDLGPQLASLKLNLDVARNLVSRDPAAAEALLVELRSQSQTAIADIRQLVFDLRPPALDELGLIGAIQEYTSQIVSQDGLHIRLDSPKDLPPLPAAVEVAAYRIALEALANFVRHSQGSNCQVTLTQADNDLQLEICDDGLGLPKEIHPGVGLSSMRERAAELGGTCMIEALPHGGTRVLARLPVG